ncbi:hypothetical protein ABZP36_014084 [Zizania latifolia]
MTTELTEKRQTAIHRRKTTEEVAGTRNLDRVQWARPASGTDAMLPTSSSWLRLDSASMRPGAMAAAAKLPRFTTYAALFPTPSPFGSRPAKPALPPISISMDPALVDPAHLQALMLACAHSCAIRASPSPPAGAAAEPVDLRKLRVALAHSFLVVSVFCSARFLDEGDGRRFLGLDLVLGRQEDRRLVGFGRAVSDVGLTASVHDVVVGFLFFII